MLPSSADRNRPQGLLRLGAFALLVAAASAGFWALFLRPSPPVTSSKAPEQVTAPATATIAGVQPGQATAATKWLSVTKSWQFEAAARNGQPVRYRLVVPLSALVSGRGLR